jgi:thiopurine S-methyltransferase
MEAAFWVDRWKSGQIGFHEGAPNDLLLAHHDRIAAARRVYVPLCGKAVDLLWLRGHGHDVVGVELVADAVAQLLSDNRLSSMTSTTGSFVRHQVHDVTGQGHLDVLQGDALAIDEDVFGAVGGVVDAIYDRAALVALHPSQREAYVRSLRRVLRPGGVVLLIAFSYDQTKLDGPPWSVDEPLVRALFGADFDVQTLAVRDEELGPKFVAAGVTALRESCLLLTHRT